MTNENFVVVDASVTAVVDSAWNFFVGRLFTFSVKLAIYVMRTDAVAVVAVPTVATILLTFPLQLLRCSSRAAVAVKKQNIFYLIQKFRS